jgi:nitrogen fixation protein NifU and related proteins
MRIFSLFFLSFIPRQKNNRRSVRLSSRGVPGLRSSSTIAIISEVFSDTVLDHFRNPRNAGELPNADARVEVSNPVCGDVLHLAVRVNDGRVTEARFLCRGCTTSIACASLLTEHLQNKTQTEMGAINAEWLSQALGGLPPATFHGAELAADAARALLKKIPRSSD